jgi:hypothetical protein
MIGAYIRKLPYLSTGLQPLSPSRPMPETIPNLTGQSTLGLGSTDPTGTNPSLDVVPKDLSEKSKSHVVMNRTVLFVRIRNHKPSTSHLARF